ncbi:sensor histidine kinase [Streptomyces sp. NPDC006430]|uniref:sensor histidine kinase n=1 Tax=Streptomyces sp. NPDC006430 TaxID=3154299 RepID=UPI0033A3869E
MPMRNGGGRGGGARGPRPGADAFTWTRNDALVSIGTAAVDLSGYSIVTAGEGRPLTVGALVILVMAALCLLTRRRHPMATLAAVVASSVLLNLAVPLDHHFSASLAVALYSVGRVRRPVVTAVAGAACVPLSLIGQNGTAAAWVAAALANAIAVLLTAGAGVAMGRWHREVEANRTLLADRAVAEERRRIARELHDIVAHHITTMQLMAGGARANLVHDPAAAREALITLEGSGRMALGEMRQLLDVLRAGEEPESSPPAPQPGTEDLARIITESRLAGTETEFTVDGPVRVLPPIVGLTVFRIVQEALTNTRKHAGQARARVRLTYRPDEVAVEVCDDGAGARKAAPPPAPSRSGTRSGYGLIGMRERVALQGGTLEAATVDGGGFRVVARLPLAAGAGAAGAEGGEHHR